MIGGTATGTVTEIGRDTAMKIVVGDYANPTIPSTTLITYKASWDVPGLDQALIASPPAPPRTLVSTSLSPAYACELNGVKN